jgi:hypothetical protein
MTLEPLEPTDVGQYDVVTPVASAPPQASSGPKTLATKAPELPLYRSSRSAASMDPTRLYNEPLPWSDPGVALDTVATALPPVYAADLAELATFDVHVTDAILTMQNRGQWNTSADGSLTLEQRIAASLKAGQRADLVKNLLFQIAYPENITAVAPNATRTATAAQALLALNEPARYFAIAQALVEAGSTTLRTGQVLTLHSEDARWVESHGQASDVCWRLNATLQAAFLRFGSIQTSKLSSEHQAPENADSPRPGLDMGQFNRLNHVLLGHVVFADAFERLPARTVLDAPASGGAPPTVSEQRAQWVQAMGLRLQELADGQPQGFLLVTRDGRAHAKTVAVSHVSNDGQVIIYQDPLSNQSVKVSLNDLSYQIAIPADTFGRNQVTTAKAGGRQRP